MQDLEAKAARQSALIYTGFSLGMVVLFLLATLITGRAYNGVARFGGAVWVFLLSMIIAMPIVIPSVKKRILG